MMQTRMASTESFSQAHTTDLSARARFNEQQQERWNGTDGEYWVEQQEKLDRTLMPVLGPLLEFASPRPGSTVIDIGCGCGATTIELAKAVGPGGHVVGIDLSEPMLARAKERLRNFANASCRLGDATKVALADMSAELALSRFGVMFFGDPVAAFANIRSGLAPHGRLRFACWRSIQENPWMAVPLQAVLKHVPPLPKPEPEEPGPFSFAETERVTRILTAAGFSAPRFEGLAIEMDLDAGGSPEDAAMEAANRGPAKRALENQPEEVRAAAIASIREMLAPYASASGVKLPGSVWLVAAERL